jgi:diguanylate cyclase (GGDEF)-like protein/PAS domain S-box-containing protein
VSKLQERAATFLEDIVRRRGAAGTAIVVAGVCAAASMAISYASYALAGIAAGPVLLVLPAAIPLALAGPFAFLWARSIQALHRAEAGLKEREHGLSVEIGERRRAEGRLRDAIESLADGFLLWDADDRLVVCNRRAHRLGPGLAETLVPGALFTDVLHQAVARGDVRPPAGTDPEAWIAERIARHRCLQGPVEIEAADGRRYRILETRTNDGGVVALQVDITEMRRMENVLRTVAEGVSAGDGGDFFQSLVASVAATLDADFVFVGELVGETRDRVRAIAVHAGGTPGRTFDYPLDGTPCADLLSGRSCLHVQGVREKYPRDRVLADLGAESYLGMALVDQGGRAIGNMVVASRRPLRDPATAESLLRIFAARIVAELIRLKSEEAVRESERLYRSFVELLPVSVIVHRDGTVIYANPAAMRLYGATDAGNLIGRPLLDFVAPKMHGAVVQRLHEIYYAGRAVPPVEQKHVRLDGTTIHVEATGTPVIFLGETAVMSVARDITEHKRAGDALRASEQRFRDFAESSSDWFWEMGPDLRFTYFSERLFDVLGVRPETAIGKSSRDLAADKTDGKWRRHLADLEARRPFRDFEYTLRDHRGRTRIIRLSGRPVLDEAGTFLGYRGVGTDVTEIKLAEEEVRTSGERLRAILEASPIGVAISRPEDGLVLFANTRLAELHGLAPDQLVGTSARRFYVDPDDRERLRERLAAEGRVRDAEIPFRREGGRTFWSLLSMDTLDFQGQRALLTWLYDVSQLKEAHEQLARLAHFDPLTGLANRRMFMDQLRQVLARARRKRSRGALLFCDLDGFKEVNDTLGHEFGDWLLTETGRRLQACVREVDLVARVGGDEFTVVLEDLRTPRDAEAVADKVVETVAKPFRWQAREAQVGISVGIAYFDDTDRDIDALVGDADRAMYLAKRAGKGTFRVHLRPHAGPTN